ncbi:ATP-binding protein [Nitrosovibrio sp. Nv4]|uniref:ATP-binding protein n=1 Tax=Nitrosovibrio sp. Nv4 TaxID=1945880 RepID=UPI000BC809EA|nr:ATP-binding protein [Nitrosovibrio sp. Nv4]SOD42478.1 hypothetical protein SAMN06298226_2820 [Nitrosovibrio sp. Nv4]
MQIFVNRIPERKTFHSLLLGQEDPNVLVYHGISGIGKTTLLRKLRNEIAEDANIGAISGSVNFAEPEYGRADEALKRLRRELAVGAKAAKTSLMFNAFDLAIYAYTDKAFGAERSKPLADELRQLSDGPLQWMLRKAAGPAGGYIPVVGSLFRDVVNQAIDHIKKEHALAAAPCEVELRQLQWMDDAEILQLLPSFFGHDLTLYKQRSDALHVAIFMDSYDKLWGGLEAEQHRRGTAMQDEWVRQLIINVPRVLFVIAGQNKLNWENLSQTHTARPEQYELSGLQREDAFQFLKLHGIDDQSSLSDIFKTTQGHPFWLKLVTERYLRAVRDGCPIIPVILGMDEASLLDSLCIGLTREEQQTIKQLSAVVYFDEALFKRLLSGPLETGYPKQRFGDFTQLSFVEKLTDEHYAIHSVMKAPMLRELEKKDPGILQMIRNAQSRYFQEKGLPFGVDPLIQGYDDVARILNDYDAGLISTEQLQLFLDSEVFSEILEAATRTRSEMEIVKKWIESLRETTKKMEDIGRALRADAEKTLNEGESVTPPKLSDSSESDKN